MIVRALDTDGDWEFGKGKNDYKSANKAIEQNIGTRLNSFLGDCFFDNSAGLDWFNLLGTKNLLALKLAINAAILNTEGVTKILSVDVLLESSNRLATFTYIVETIYTQVDNTNILSGVTNFILTEDGDVLTTEDGGGIMGG